MDIRDGELGAYHTYEEAMEEIERAAAEHPDIAKVETIGYSTYGRPIKAIKISKDVNVEDPDKPEVLYMGQTHAREVISAEASLGVVDRLIDGYGTDDYVTGLVDSRQIWVVPVVNPDGSMKVADDVTGSGDSSWRGNCRDNNGNGKVDDGDGVDLNRNWGRNWGGQGSSGTPGSQTYRGPVPFSEPETAAIKKLVEEHDFVTSVSFHSYSGLILYPLGYTNTPAKDEDMLRSIAENMRDRQPNEKYKVEKSSDLYVASGDSDDWLYEDKGIMAFTFEVYKGGNNWWNTFKQFNPPEDRIQYHVDNVVPAALYAAEIADDPSQALVEREERDAQGPPAPEGPRDPADYWPEDDSPYFGGIPGGGGYMVSELGTGYNPTDDPNENYRFAECEPACEG